MEFRKAFVLSWVDACANQKETSQNKPYVLNCAALLPVYENKFHSSVLFLHAEYYFYTMKEDTSELILDTEAHVVLSV